MSLSARDFIQNIFLGRPLDWSQCAIEPFLAESKREWIQPLLLHFLSERGELSRAPAEVRNVLTAAARLEAVLEEARRLEVAAVLTDFAAKGIEAILFKGTALSYSLYAEPGLRPRCDTDLLVPKALRQRAFECLEYRGYQPENMTSGELVSHQLSFIRNDAVHSTVDVHWKLSNAQLFADLLSWERVAAEALPIEGLAGARQPSWRHSLLIACFHRVAHHFDHEDLLWIYDIHLLAEKLGPKGLAEFRAWAVDLGVWSICRRGLELSHNWFATAIPEGLLEALPEPDEAEAYLSPRGKLGDIWINLKRARNWPERLHLLKEHALPPREYMARKFPEATPKSLPLYYVLRLVSGLYRGIKS